MLALKHVASGKVREIYEVDEERLLFVATDRISAYDVVLPDTIPDKGRVLTGLSLHWFDFLETPNHFLTTDLGGIGLSDDEAAELTGRAMIVRRADVIPMECVVRGYLYGSSWREYRAGGGPTTEHLPAGLQMAQQLPEPLFTPATKAESGHDENLTVAGARELVGDEVYERLRSVAIDLYRRAAVAAAEKGVLLADTKFEFGFVGDELLLVDEVLTPDSSRYWPADKYEIGAVMPSYDKQYVRDWLDSTGWDRTPPAPAMPDDVKAATRSRYIEAFELLTGTAFDRYLR
ncbi:phosphoribosylaminoimidazole-succinocarboxamide synthase [bacterium BMS3Abin02]|nr:phosphoribosylaminoimidazole-succinocarboxamide synthase [bacterium BMS3Abin02]